MNAGLFVCSLALSAILTAATAQASPVTYQKEAITENNLPVFYPQLKKTDDLSKFMAGREIY